MNDSGGLPFKEIAWNGIRFTAPVDWEIVKIGARYLMLEGESGPALEIKWRQVGEAFSHADQLRRLSEYNRKQPGVEVRKCSVPKGWKQALVDYQSSGFCWKEENLSGAGVTLYCPACRNATLIQFFSKPFGKPGDIPKRILVSFQDHTPNHPIHDSVNWSMFDIRARVPKAYLLERYRFDAGEYRLDFHAGDQRIFLHRWAAASFLLDKYQGLNRFAADLFRIPEKAFQSTSINGCSAVGWEIESSGTWIDRFKVKPPHRWLRLWHLEKKNRLLGVLAEGRKPFDAELLGGICARYDSL